MGFDPSTAKPLTAFAGTDATTSDAMDAVDKAGGVVDVKVGPDGKVTNNSAAKGVFNPATAKPFDPTSAKPVAKPVETPKTEQQLPAIGDVMPQAGQAETGAALASGMLATPAAGLAGLGTAIAKAFGITDADPAEVIKKVQGALTYQPQSEAGKSGAEFLAKPFELLAKGADKAGGAVTDLTGSPALGTAVNTAIQASPMLLGAGAKKAMPALQEMEAASAAQRAKISALEAPVRDGVKAARDAGFIMTPTDMKAGLIARTTEGAVGSARLEKSMSRNNAEVANDFIRRDVGLPDNVPLSGEALTTQLEKLGPTYEKVKALGNLAIDEGNYKPGPLSPKIETFDNGSKWLNPAEQKYMSATDAVESLKQLRAEARDYYKSYKANPHPDTLKAAESRMAEANNLEDLIDWNAKMRGQPELLSELRQARAQGAKIYLADKALNEQTGNINPSVYARELEKATFGNTPLTGGSLQVAKFASQFPKVAQRVERLGNTDMSSQDLATALFKKAGGLAADVAVAGLRPTVRAAMKTNVVQNAMMPSPKTGASLPRKSLTTLADIQSQPITSLAELSAEQRK